MTYIHTQHVYYKVLCCNRRDAVTSTIYRAGQLNLNFQQLINTLLVCSIVVGSLNLIITPNK